MSTESFSDPNITFQHIVAQARTLSDADLRTLIATLRSLLHRPSGKRREGNERIKR